MFYAIQCGLLMLLYFAIGGYALYVGSLPAAVFFVTLANINMTGLFIIGACRK